MLNSICSDVQQPATSLPWTLSAQLLLRHAVHSASQADYGSPGSGLGQSRNLQRLLLPLGSHIRSLHESREHNFGFPPQHKLDTYSPATPDARRSIWGENPTSTKDDDGKPFWGFRPSSKQGHLLPGQQNLWYSRKWLEWEPELLSRSDVLALRLVLVDAPVYHASTHTDELVVGTDAKDYGSALEWMIDELVDDFVVRD